MPTISRPKSTGIVCSKTRGRGAGPPDSDDDARAAAVRTLHLNTVVLSYLAPRASPASSRRSRSRIPRPSGHATTRRPAPTAPPPYAPSSRWARRIVGRQLGQRSTDIAPLRAFRRHAQCDNGRKRRRLSSQRRHRTMRHSCRCPPPADGGLTAHSVHASAAAFEPGLLHYCPLLKRAQMPLILSADRILTDSRARDGSQGRTYSTTAPAAPR